VKRFATVKPEKHGEIVLFLCVSAVNVAWFKGKVSQDLKEVSFAIFCFKRREAA